VNVLVGTSGYSYKQWKGSFYPADLPAAAMLRFYAQRLRTVEINNTFYRMPSEALLAGWAEDVPESFTFVLKASRRITHVKRLSNVGEELAYFFRVASVLGRRLGPVLFQLPPFSKKDAGRLRDFLAQVPEGRRVALEFRHESWFDDEVYDVLRSRGAALCVADVAEDDGITSPLVATAPWGYLRLRRPDYGEPELAQWSERIRAQAWDSAFVFFKHEDEGKGAAFAERLAALAAVRPE
jgi:uncharacterized protein YecE (DUF72 family)